MRRLENDFKSVKRGGDSATDDSSDGSGQNDDPDLLLFGFGWLSCYHDGDNRFYNQWGIIDYTIYINLYRGYRISRCPSGPESSSLCGRWCSQSGPIETESVN